jgi:hypothetical protein
MYIKSTQKEERPENERAACVLVLVSLVRSGRAVTQRSDCAEACVVANDRHGHGSWPSGPCTP